MRPARMRATTRLRRTTVAATAGIVLLAGCTGPPGDSAATVNGTSISEAEFEATVRAQAASEQSPVVGLEGEQRTTQLDELQRRVLTQLIQMQLLRDIASQHGLELTEAEIEDRWQQEISLQGGDEQTLLDRIAAIGLTVEQAREQLGMQVLQDKLRESLADDVDVTDAEVRQLFDERADQFERADVSHILVEDEAEANAIIDLLEQGQSFEELATARSLDQGSAQQGGRLGVQPRGQYVAPFDEAVWSAEEGEIVGPVETQFGYHVIRVNAFETRTFEDVEESLRDELADRRVDEVFQQLVRELFDEAEVRVDSRFGRWDAASGQVVAADPLAPADDRGAPTEAPTGPADS